jgi:hypothetical protein
LVNKLPKPSPVKIANLDKYIAFAITDAEPLLKEQIVAAADPVFDYLLMKSQTLDVSIYLGDIKEILSVVSSEVPALVKSLLASVFSEEAGRNMGKAAAAYYKELKSGGLPEQAAVKLTEDYMRTFTGIGDMLRMGGGRRSNVGEKDPANVSQVRVLPPADVKPPDGEHNQLNGDGKPQGSNHQQRLGFRRGKIESKEKGGPQGRGNDGRVIKPNQKAAVLKCNVLHVCRFPSKKAAARPPP